jgi:hypothetical protein
MSTKGSTHFTGDIAMPSIFSEKALSHVTTYTNPDRNAAASSRAIRNPPSPLLLPLDPHQRATPRPRTIRPAHGSSSSSSEIVARPHPPLPIGPPLLTPRADRLRLSPHRGPSATSPPPPPPPRHSPKLHSKAHSAAAASATAFRRQRIIDPYAAARPRRAERWRRA